MDPKDAEAYVGRSRVMTDPMAVEPARHMALMLDGDGAGIDAGAPLPPLWHWIYFHDFVAQSELGADGHEPRGAFLPPVAYPRRMWAASRVQFAAPLRLGHPAERHSTIASVTFKEGRSGPLCFVDVRHEVTQGGALCLTDTHTIVYRKPGPKAVSETRGSAASEAFPRIADSRLLFRYSALTYNAHRIHYDPDFAVDHEGYPGLVVHGPLMATLAMEEARARHPGRPIAGFAFRGKTALFDLEPFRVVETPEGDTSRVALEKAPGVVCVEAEVLWG